MNAFRAILVKDFWCIWRAQHLLVSCFFFSLLLVVVASFSFRHTGIGAEELAQLTPGILAMIFLFSGILGLNYSFAAEYENRSMVGILLSDIDPLYVYLSKFLNNYLFISCIQIFSVFVHVLFFGVSIVSIIGPVVGLCLLLNAGFVALGTLLSAISAVSRGREILLPLILFPLLIPLVAGFVFLLREVLLTEKIDLRSFWFALMVVFDVISFALSSILFEYLVKDHDN